MKNRMLKVGTAVPSLKVADVQFNTKVIQKGMVANKDCGVLVFPELCLCGYTCADLFQHAVLLEACESAIAQLAKASEKLPGLTVVVGTPVFLDNNLYNCAAVISEGQIAGLVPKIHVPMYGEFYEGRWFRSGKDVIGRTIMYASQEVPMGIDLLFEDLNSEALLGCEICEDLWVCDKPSTHACLSGATIIANLSASDELIGKQDYRRNLVFAQSGACYCAYLYSSSGTGESSTDLVFSGHSLIAENGSLLAESIFTQETNVQTAIVDLSTIFYNRCHQSTYNVEDTGWYRRIPVAIQSLGAKKEVNPETLARLLKKEGYAIAPNPFVPQADHERMDRCHRILEIQANGLATRVKATGIQNLVIGISGGLDSTLALLVAVEARKLVKGIRIIGVTMPSENTTKHTHGNAQTLMETLHLDEIHEIPIGNEVEAHLGSIGHGKQYQGEGDTTYENAQARMRTYILMDLANMKNGLVVGTGDLSELALGWCTYNGDHMSMYAVNSSVPKTLVQYICRVYAEECGNEALKKVLIAICDTPITPELTPSKNGKIAQKTEDAIGKYDLNDFFLYYTLRYGFEPSRTCAFALCAYPKCTREEVKTAAIRFYNRFFHQQFKRSCLPDGPKVGSVTLSPRGDWRMPSDASVALWLNDLEAM